LDGGVSEQWDEVPRTWGKGGYFILVGTVLSVHGEATGRTILTPFLLLLLLIARQ